MGPTRAQDSHQNLSFCLGGASFGKNNGYMTQHSCNMAFQRPKFTSRLGATETTARLRWWEHGPRRPKTLSKTHNTSTWTNMAQPASGRQPQEYELSFQSMKWFRTETSKAMFRDRQIGIGVNVLKNAFSASATASSAEPASFAAWADTFMKVVKLVHGQKCLSSI